jgi:DNA-binding transcriptional ArsR family regulator
MAEEKCAFDLPACKTTLTFDNPLEAQGYCVVPAAVMRDPKLSPEAKSLYSLLRYYAARDGIFPGMGELAKNLGVTVQKVSKLMKELSDAGLVRKEG